MYSSIYLKKNRFNHQINLKVSRKSKVNFFFLEPKCTEFTFRMFNVRDLLGERDPCRSASSLLNTASWRFLAKGESCLYFSRREETSALQSTEMYIYPLIPFWPKFSLKDKEALRDSLCPECLTYCNNVWVFSKKKYRRCVQNPFTLEGIISFRIKTNSKAFMSSLPCSLYYFNLIRVWI